MADPQDDRHHQYPRRAAHIFSDVLARPDVRSDAVMLAEITHIPSMVWGAIWIVAAVVAAAGFLYLSVARFRSSS